MKINRVAVVMAWASMFLFGSAFWAATFCLLFDSEVLYKTAMYGLAVSLSLLLVSGLLGWLAQRAERERED